MGYQQQNKKAPKHLQAKYLSAYGADDAIRTRDLILTKDNAQLLRSALNVCKCPIYRLFQRRNCIMRT